MIERENIPTSWELPKLREVCDVIMGQSPSSETYNTNGNGLPFFQGKKEFTELHPVAEKWCSEPNKIAQANDILISVRAPVGATNIADQTCCIGRGLAAIRYSSNYLFVFYFLRLIEKLLDEQGTGTTFKAISGDVLKETDFPFPPLAEQKRIVSKIEELFTELDKGIEQLEAAQQQLKVYRQAVLKWAFEGKLTNENLNGELPKGWEWKTIDEVADISTGVTPLRSNKSFWENGTIPWITSGALNDLFVFNADEFVTQKAFNETTLKLLPKHTLLLALYGEGKTRGKCSELMFESTTNQAVAAIKMKQEFEEYRKYLKWFLLKNYNDIRLLSAGGVQPNLNSTIVKKTKFPFPHSIEKEKIIQQIESRLSVCDKIEETIETTLKQSEILRYSILKKAFEGKLVKQNPKDEPAQKLLERIRAEKKKNEPEKKSNNKKKFQAA